MKSSPFLAVAISFPLVACGSSSSSPLPQASTSTTSSTSVASSSSGQGSGGAPGTASSSGAGATTGSAGGGLSADMRRISGGVPAFASSGPDDFSGPQKANDDDPSTSWGPPALPAWIAYDLSTAPADERQSVLVVWNSLHVGSYLNTAPPSGGQMPTDYTIEVNSAPGGTAAPPTDGWTTVATVTGNLRGTLQHPVLLNGGNWVRMSITQASDPTVALDLDVFSTPQGDTDDWMFMGDSITYITMPYAFSNLPQLVHAANPERWPAIINAAIGGTNTSTAVSVIADTMSGFSGHYVVLAYGTNDHPDEFPANMETLVKDVIAAGKIPVVPHMPWSALSNIQTEGPLINQEIDQLYQSYPQILRGPDLWAAFTNRTDLIPDTDVHPNAAGSDFLRQQWATTIAAVP